jgi:hypothetical protein
MAPNAKASAMPLRALQSRLDTAEAPSWMIYLSKQLQMSEDNLRMKFSAHVELNDKDDCVAPRTSSSRKLRSVVAAAASPVKGRVWQLAQQPNGSREVQQAFSCLQSSEDFLALAGELSGHVVEAMQCPHANYVLQSCILVDMPAMVKLIMKEIIEAGADVVLQAARHRFGCRVIQRLFEVCTVPEVGLLDDISALAECLIDDACALCLHPYGNYTIQHVLLHGSEEHHRQLHIFLKDRVADMAAHFYASAVVGQALHHGSVEDKLALAHALVNSPGLLNAMSQSRHGGAAARRALEFVRQVGSQ